MAHASSVDAFVDAGGRRGPCPVGTGRDLEEALIMSYGVIHFFPGGTQDQYEASVAAVHPGPGLLPDGQIFHAAGPSEGGWTVMAIHDSQQSWEHFRDTSLMPALQVGVEGGFTTPQETAVDVYALMP